MSEHRLLRRVNEVANRLRLLRVHRRMSWMWLLAAGLAGAMTAFQLLSNVAVMPPGAWLATATLMLALGIVVGARARSNPHEAAQLVEHKFQDLDSRLLTAVEQRPDGEFGGYGFLQHEVISDALLHAHRHDWSTAVASGSMARAKLRNMGTLLLFLGGAVAVAWSATGREPLGDTLAGLDTSLSTGTPYAVVVDPGHVSIERGTGLLVMARFESKLPDEVALVTTDQGGREVRIDLSKSLDDPVFGGRIPQVNDRLSYHVEFDGQTSEEYDVTVFDYPELVRADAIVQYPTYTALGEKTIEDVRRISVVEGSELTLLCLLNKPVVSAQLTGEEHPDGLQLSSTDDPTRVSVTWTPAGKQTLELHLTDEEGRANKHPPTFVIDVLPNNPPDLKIAFPARDTRVSPLEELALEAQVWDDYGLQEYGLVYQTPSGDERQLSLGEGSGGEEKRELSHLIEFESLGAEPLQLVSYYFYADDVGPDGQSRRTFSDMYFAEVRHFEEIFRQSMNSTPQGQQQQQQQSGGQQVDQLVNLQRQIVNATWNLIRRETKPQPSADYPEDVGTIAESQQQAIELAAAQQAEVEDPQSAQHLQEALEQMSTAEGHLSLAVAQGSVQPLPDVRRAAQGAYQALLKLQAREHQVQQSQQASSSGSQRAGQQQFQQQLNNLELKNNRNRYETESQAQAQPAADREQLQVLNRLSELAQRQQDVNEKLKELEAALRMAQTEQEREEIERQLKRLREEQQELLRDLDEVQERMNQQQNRQQMSDAREQLEQTREQIRRTTDALEEGQLSRALTSGTRAERELKDLEEEFRDRTASQFSESMREMRNEARELDERQQELSDRLNGRAEDPTDAARSRPSLQDDTSQEQELGQGFAEQEQRVSDLMRQMEDVVREAEASEPLLSRKLYDAIRQSRVDQPEESLAMTSELLRRGFRREASVTEQQATEGIDRLREGIEDAAESILGNELESLRRAQSQLDRLSKALGDELAAEDPDSQQEPSTQAQGRGGDEQAEGTDRSSEQSTQGGSAQQPPESAESRPQSSGSAGTSRQAGEQRQPAESENRSSSSPSGQPRSGEQSAENPGQEGEAQGSQGTPGSEREGQQSPGQGQPSQQGQQPGGEESRSPRQGGREGSLADLVNRLGGVTDGGGAGGPHLGPQRPLTGGDFSEWSDQMRDVEEMLDDPELRAEVAQIRDRARRMRIDVKRHSKTPDWELVRTSIYAPMLELQDRISEEIARRRPDAERAVPIDRDPVPDRYVEIVRRYYERLGAGQ